VYPGYWDFLFHTPICYFYVFIPFTLILWPVPGLEAKSIATDTQILNQRYRYISAEHTLAIYHSQPFVIVTSSAWLMKGVKKRRMGLRRGRGSRRVVIESAVKLQSRLRFHYAAP